MSEEVDLRGEYRHPDARGPVFVERPADLAKHGIIYPEDLIERTWGKEGVEEYRVAKEEASA